MSGSATADPLASLLVVILFGSMGVIALNIGIPSVLVMGGMAAIVTAAIIIFASMAIRRFE